MMMAIKAFHRFSSVFALTTHSTQQFTFQVNAAAALPFLALMLAAASSCGATVGSAAFGYCCGCCIARRSAWRASGVCRRLAGRDCPRLRRRCDGGECCRFTRLVWPVVAPAARLLDCLACAACAALPRLSFACLRRSLARFAFAGLPSLARVCGDPLLCLLCSFVGGVCLPARTHVRQKNRG